MTQAAYTKVFLTWSGERSKAVAAALHDWLPNVIQSLEPWMSDSDIAKGSGWNAEISKNLESAKIGIVCLTPENLDAPWVNFEAGALSKLPGSYVCTYLLGLSHTDVKGPLAQFQMTKSDDKEDTKKLLRDINEKLGEQSLKPPQVDIAFDKWWPDLAIVLGAIPSEAGEERRPKRTPADLLEEVLELSREQEKKLDTTIQALLSIARVLEQLQAGSAARFWNELGDLFSMPPADLQIKRNAFESFRRDLLAQAVQDRAAHTSGTSVSNTDSTTKDDKK